MNNIIKILKAGIIENDLKMQEICCEQDTTNFNDLDVDGQRAVQTLRLLNNCLTKMLNTAKVLKEK